MALQIERVRIEGFGRLVGREYALGPGLSVVLGRNESGKSTWVACVRAILFGLSPTEAEPWRPWQPGAPFAGELTLRRGGEKITVRREFESNEIVWTVMDGAGNVKDKLEDSVAPRARRAIREEYQKRLKGLMGFSSPEIFSSCVVAQQGRLRDLDAGALGPELRARLTGGEGTDYEKALKELDGKFLEITNEERRTSAKDRQLQTKQEERRQKTEELEQARAEWARIGDCQAHLEKARAQADALAAKVAEGQELVKTLDELDKANSRIEELEKQHALLTDQVRQIEEAERQLTAAESDLLGSLRSSAIKSR